MKFGLTEAHWSIIETHLIDPLKKHGAQVWIFGSRARGDYRQFSDLDVLYSLSGPLPSGLIAKINEDMENSDLPIKIDIVSLEDLAESYRQNVLTDRILVTR